MLEATVELLEGDPSTGIASNIPRHAGALTNLVALDRAAAGHGLISAGPSDDVIRRIPLVARIDTVDEVAYFRSGGILQHVLRHLAAA